MKPSDSSLTMQAFSGLLAGSRFTRTTVPTMTQSDRHLGQLTSQKAKSMGVSPLLLLLLRHLLVRTCRPRVLCGSLAGIWQRLHISAVFPDSALPARYFSERQPAYTTGHNFSSITAVITCHVDLDVLHTAFRLSKKARHA